MICRVAFGKKYGGDEGERKFNELLGELMRLLGVFYVGDFIPSLAWVYHINGFDAQVDKVAKELDKFMEDILEEHIKYRVKRESNGDVLLEIQKDKEGFFTIYIKRVSSLWCTKVVIRPLLVDSYMPLYSLACRA